MGDFSENSTNSGLVLLIILVIGLFAIIFIKTPVSVLFGGNETDTDIAAIEARIKPVGSINVGAATASVLPPVVVVEVKPVSKIEVTVPIVCDGCHSTGVLGAPKVGSKADWIERAKQGIESLVMSASKGKGNMPPQGVSFSNDQLKEAIEAMLIKSGLEN